MSSISNDVIYSIVNTMWYDDMDIEHRDLITNHRTDALNKVYPYLLLGSDYQFKMLTKNYDAVKFLSTLPEGAIFARKISHEAIKNNDMETLERMLSLHTPRSSIGCEFVCKDLLDTASEYNNFDMFKYILDKINDWSLSLRSVAMHNRLDFIKYAESKRKVYYGSVIDGACDGGHLNIIKHYKKWAQYNVQRIAESGAKHNIEMVKYAKSLSCAINWSNVAFIAGEHGNIDVLEYALTHMPSVKWSDMAECAAENGHLEVVKFAEEHGQYNVDEVFASACTGGHLDIVKHLQGLEQKINSSSYRSGVFHASFGGHLDVVKQLMPKTDLTYDSIACCGASGGKMNIVLWAHNKCRALGYEPNWQKLAERACKFWQLEVFSYAVQKGNIKTKETGNAQLDCALYGIDNGLIYNGDAISYAEKCGDLELLIACMKNAYIDFVELKHRARAADNEGMVHYIESLLGK